MNPKIQLGGMWSFALGRNPEERFNRNHNIALFLPRKRVFFAMPRNGSTVFDPDTTDVLCQGMTYREIAQIAKDNNQELLVTIGMSYNGLENGHNYHFAVSRDDHSIVNESKVRAFTRNVLRWLKNQEVKIWGVQAGNEEGYQPGIDNSDWNEFLRNYTKCALAIRSVARAEFGSDIRVLTGGQTGSRIHHGRKSLQKHLIDEGHAENFIFCIHGNSQSNGEFRQSIRDLFEMGAQTVTVDEDRPTSGPSLALQRAKIAHEEGCIAYFFFDVRNVNAQGTNECCSWRSRGGCSAPRPELSCEGCNDWNDDRWDELVAVSVWAGEKMEGILLPFRTEDGGGSGGGTLPGLETPIHRLARLSRRTLVLQNELDKVPSAKEFLEDEAWSNRARRFLDSL